MRDRMTPDEAQTLALKALAFIVNSDQARDRFMGLSGLDGATLRARAAEPQMHVALLDFLLADEGLLVDFCKTGSLDPKAVHMARYVLGGP
jgi:hypothetical protein